jgi:hypothetical protein
VFVSVLVFVLSVVTAYFLIPQGFSVKRSELSSNRVCTFSSKLHSPTRILWFGDRTAMSDENYLQKVALCKRSRYERELAFLSNHGIVFPVSSDFNYALSTEKNYAVEEVEFVGKYALERSQLDYSYHRHYCKSRQLLHDQIVDNFLATRVVDYLTNAICESPLNNWIVFTAGPMGAGKGHTMQWLSKEGWFPLDAFARVDPDDIRSYLPEIAEYNARNDNTTGYLTQKEVGYISEVIMNCSWFWTTSCEVNFAVLLVSLGSYSRCIAER